MNYFEIASATIALPLYIPLCVNVARGRIVQSFAGWFLWTVLDLIVLTSLMASEGSFFLVLAYTVGSACVTGIILHKKMFSWTWFETMVSILVALCMVAWLLTESAEVATVASTVAIVIATLPVFKDAYQSPYRSPLFTWAGFIASNALGVAGGDAWTISERLYPATCLIFCTGLVVVAGVRRLQTPVPVMQTSTEVVS